MVRGLSVIAAYQTALGLLPAQALIRLDGLYGNGAIVVDLIAAGICFVMRGKDYALLDLTQVQQRLTLPADEQFTHPESGICRDLFDCGQVPVTAQGHRARLIVATHQAATSPIGVVRDGVVYELFFTALPALGFTAADVVMLYLHRGSFETVLADEDREQDSDRWSSYTAYGQAGLADPLSMGVESAPRTQPTVAAHLDASHRVFPPLKLKRCSAQIPLWQAHLIAPPQWARAARRGSLGGPDFLPQPDGTLRCRQGATRLTTGATPRTRWDGACALCCPHR